MAQNQNQLLHLLEKARKLVLGDSELRETLGAELDELIRKATTVLGGRKSDTVSVVENLNSEDWGTINKSGGGR